VNSFLWWRKTEFVAQIEVHGSAKFLARTRESLALLQSTPYFAQIQRHIAVIRQGRRSGMKADAAKPAFIVGRRTWSHSALWYAGAIAHDSHHSKLYHDEKTRAGGNPPLDCWTGQEAERKCLAFQIEVMAALGADRALLAYLGGLEKNPTYQGHNRGWRGWLDYWLRWW